MTTVPPVCLVVAVPVASLIMAIAVELLAILFGVQIVLLFVHVNSILYLEYPIVFIFNVLIAQIRQCDFHYPESLIQLSMSL